MPVVKKAKKPARSSSAMKRTGKRAKLIKIDNPIQVQGFNVQRIELPIQTSDPDRFIQQNEDLIERLRRRWRRQVLLADAIGTLLGAGILAALGGLVYLAISR